MAISTDARRVVAYSAPIVVFGLLTSAGGLLPASSYPVADAVKIAAVTAALLFWSEPLRGIRPTWRTVAPSVVLGMAIIAGWLAIDKALPYPHLGDRVGFDPSSMGNRRSAWPFSLFGSTDWCWSPQ